MFVMWHHVKLFHALTCMKTSSVCGFIIFLDVMTFVSTTLNLAAGGIFSLICIAWCFLNFDL